MGDADELLFVTEGDNGMPVLKPDHARGHQARRGEAHELIEEDAAARIASAEFKAMLGLRHHLCGIIIPQAIAATICGRSSAECWVKFGWECSQRRPHLRLRFIHIASLLRTVAAPLHSSCPPPLR
jgi:hypothetical protein